MQKTIRSKTSIYTMTIIFFVALNSAVQAMPNRTLALELAMNKRYKQAQQIFEQNLRATLSDPDTAIDYAIVLFESGRTVDATKVCRDIQRDYPNTDAAKDARSLVLNRTGKYSPQDLDLGIIGLKFKGGFGRPVKVEVVFHDTPAEKVDIRAHDLITSVNGRGVQNLTEYEIAKLLTGKAGTKVVLTIQRERQTQQKILTRVSLRKLASKNKEIRDKIL